MATSQKTGGHWALDTLSLKFLILPFRLTMILFIMIFIIFGVSLLSQSYFSDQKREMNEIQYIESINKQKPLLDKNNTSTESPLYVYVYQKSYLFLSTLFFEWTGINQALQSNSEKDPNYQFKVKYIEPHLDKLNKFDLTLKLTSLRLGYIAYFGILTMILTFVAVVDGFVNRAIRQKNASRESAGIYHRAKYWRSGILWLGIITFLAWPAAISPYWLFIPTIAFSFFVWLQAKYLKKYL